MSLSLAQHQCDLYSFVVFSARLLLLQKNQRELEMSMILKYLWVQGASLGDYRMRPLGDINITEFVSCSNSEM